MGTGDHQTMNLPPPVTPRPAAPKGQGLPPMIDTATAIKAFEALRDYDPFDRRSRTDYATLGQPPAGARTLSPAEARSRWGDLRTGRAASSYITMDVIGEGTWRPWYGDDLALAGYWLDCPPERFDAHMREKGAYAERIVSDGDRRAMRDVARRNLYVLTNNLAEASYKLGIAAMANPLDMVEPHTKSRDTAFVALLDAIWEIT